MSRDSSKVQHKPTLEPTAVVEPTLDRGVDQEGLPNTDEKLMCAVRNLLFTFNFTILVFREPKHISNK